MRLNGIIKKIKKKVEIGKGEQRTDGINQNPKARWQI